MAGTYAVKVLQNMCTRPAIVNHALFAARVSLTNLPTALGQQAFACLWGCFRPLEWQNNADRRFEVVVQGRLAEGERPVGQ
jgi:hypothetical protein